MPRYPHRHNPDGTYDSICTICFVNVCSSCEEEAKCFENEKAHVCDPAVLIQHKVVLIKPEKL